MLYPPGTAEHEERTMGQDGTTRFMERQVGPAAAAAWSACLGLPSGNFA